VRRLDRAHTEDSYRTGSGSIATAPARRRKGTATAPAFQVSASEKIARRLRSNTSMIKKQHQHHEKRAARRNKNKPARPRKGGNTKEQESKSLPQTSISESPKQEYHQDFPEL